MKSYLPFSPSPKKSKAVKEKERLRAENEELLRQRKAALSPAARISKEDPPLSPISTRTTVRSPRSPRSAHFKHKSVLALTADNRLQTVKKVPTQTKLQLQQNYTRLMMSNPDQSRQIERLKTELVQMRTMKR
jgi:hypothetical protein